MTDVPVELIPLENGLTLELYDSSKKLVGDRWTVTLVARIEVPVEDTEVASELGPRVTYEQKRERVFVGDGEKGTVFGELRTSFLASQQQYLARASFPERLVQRQLFQHRQKRR